MWFHRKIFIWGLHPKRFSHTLDFLRKHTLILLRIHMLNHTVGKDHMKLIILTHMHIESVTLQAARALFVILFFALMEVQQGYIIFKTAARPDLAGTTHIQNVATGSDRQFLQENSKPLFS